MTADDADWAIAAALLEATGNGAPIGLERLAGGKNNRVSRVDTAAGRFLLKQYFVEPRDGRDRLGAEWSFLEYLVARGIRGAPRPVARLVEAHAALYSFVDGRKPASDEIDGVMIDAAADFIIAVNSAPRALETLKPGSEACFRLADHLATVERRILRLERLDAQAPLFEAAASLVEARLRPAWRRIARDIEDEAAARAVPLHARLLDSEIIASPSDFGFHNCLIDGRRELFFIDFEYAGQDDPAKLVCDFFCCPEIVAPGGFFGRFVDRLGGALPLGPDFAWRARLLLDLYRIKWICIMLNDFLPVDAGRRRFALGEARAGRCALQLDKAERAFDRLAQSRPGM